MGQSRDGWGIAKRGGAGWSQAVVQSGVERGGVGCSEVDARSRVIYG